MKKQNPRHLLIFLSSLEEGPMRQNLSDTIFHKNRSVTRTEMWGTDLEKGLGLLIPHPHTYLHRVCVVLCCPWMDISNCSKPALRVAKRAHGWEKLHRSSATVCTSPCQSRLQTVKRQPESFWEAEPSFTGPQQQGAQDCAPGGQRHSFWKARRLPAKLWVLCCGG